MKSLNQPQLQLALAVLNDLGEKCSTDVSRDLKTIKTRYEHEGDSFLTITLPRFCDDFFKSLEQGITSDLFIGWKKRSCLPAFLQGFTRCSDTKQQGACYAAIRQLCYLFKKQKISCTDERTIKALEQYKETDETLKAYKRLSSFDRLVGRMIINEIFPNWIDFNDLSFHHGPGAVLEKLTPNQKYAIKRLAVPERFKDTPLDIEMMYNSEESFHLDTVEPTYYDDVDCPVRVITVPKTQTSPRVIAIEPTYVQFLQQGVKDYMVEKIESNRLTAGHINFANQQINRDLAFNNSISRELGTIDMKEASDRIINDHVKCFFSVNQDLNYLLQITRSPYALVNGELILLNKFASMGSATCFPVEALMFFIFGVSYRLQKAALAPTSANIFNVARKIYVYGDDILMPSNEVEDFTRFLRERGSIVSEKKTFYRSFFRESCGCDAYAGIDITPVYLRQTLDVKSTRDSRKILSLVATGNQLLEKGLFRAFSTIQCIVEKVTGKLPYCLPTSPGIGWVDPFIKNEYRWNRTLHRPEVRTYVPSVQKFTDHITGYPALMKALIVRPDERKIRPGKKDMSRHQSVRRESVTLRIRWTTAY